MDWMENRGSMPRHLKGTKIFVRLRNGIEPIGPWPAEGCDWTTFPTKPHNFDITHWRPA